ncbi:YetF domain-containing protein [Cohnella hongkongensis]|uniref:YetF domain-containing protein n=1 Tax=Cohnella hongkongensis TaxID=178337 RepID=A0ABV9FJR7_9BACL
MEMATILLRTIFMYFFIFLIMRMMGKREIGKLSVFDLVISIMIAEIAVIVIESTEKTLLTAVAPIVLLVVIQLGIAFLSLKNRTIRLLIDGKPSVLIQDGHLNRREMFRQRYNMDDLMLQLRENQVSDIAEVKMAVLESTGKLSVIMREQRGIDSSESADDRQSGVSGAAADAKSEAGPKIRYELLPLPLIMDGQVQDDNLNKLGKTRFWLKSELQPHGVDSFKQVFFCSIDHKGKLYVDKKE